LAQCLAPSVQSMPSQRNGRKWRSSLALRCVAVAVLCAVVGIPVLSFVAPSALSSSDVSLSAGQGSLDKGLAGQGALEHGLPSKANPKELGQVSRLRSLRMKAGTTDGAAQAPAQEEGGFDLKLVFLIFLWYVGNWYHNATNKVALAAGGGLAGFPMTISAGYLGVGALYALFLWAAPDARPMPQITAGDYMRTLPVSFAAAAAHMASCAALSAGSLSFVQIVKAMEPAFAAVVGALFYSTNVSPAKWMALLPIIGGVAVASMGDLSFAWGSLFIASVANAFAAVKGLENKKLMSTAGFKDRVGSIGNQFAITTINSFLFCVVLAAICEGHKFGSFVQLITSGGKGTIVLKNMIASGLWFYFYNELATITIKKTGAVTQSVLNTAKRAFVMIGAAILLREGLSTIKLVGSLISIAGVFLYTNIDSWRKK